MAPYRILSLDGGGIRGLLTAIILERLNLMNPGWLGKVEKRVHKTKSDLRFT